jgi:hypothetical protein
MSVFTMYVIYSCYQYLEMEMKSARCPAMIPHALFDSPIPRSILPDNLTLSSIHMFSHANYYLLIV